jgi:hypothetical protein
MANEAARQPVGPASLADLATALKEAETLVDELDRDSVIRDVLRTFRLMPFEDRGVIAEALSREVQARRLSLATQDVTGQSMHPNPNARLYLRAHETTVPRSLLEREELMLALTRAMRLAPVLRMPAIHDELIDALRLALEHVDGATRAEVAVLLRETLAIVAAD